MTCGTGTRWTRNDKGRLRPRDVRVHRAALRLDQPRADRRAGRALAAARDRAARAAARRAHPRLLLRHRRLGVPSAARPAGRSRSRGSISARRCSIAPRGARAGPRRTATFVQGDVMAMPFADGAFDGATMGFSLAQRRRRRRHAARDPARAAARRPLRQPRREQGAEPGVQAACSISISIASCRWSAASSAARAWRTTYLPNSLTHHPNAPELRERFARAGFADAGYLPLMGGAIAIHYGTKP